ncbi:UDP-glucose 4-epimerase [BD1-7 clade bacterium]|uniref:UDP-glucose 4-epimerase n=1 Tax=BD1-7 clade bacterium TaxID=2029982 RepID=A0A5S9QN07_9GAMM|nr:UDP-glucose 4-epimerase [BD1-7 clade bacterium]CAA0115884.1 UDP-glucose 4-epimerase [BD1-7 clade bacterium]CAA0119554.1 UDP-glucose 4-epimerase [BD1-7 clade bacterium]
MSILVTGGAGYIGSHTCVELLDAGYDVIVIDNECNSDPESIRRVEKIAGKSLRYVKMDVRDKPALDALFESEDISAVIHFAGLKAVGESVAQPVRYYQNNVEGTLCLVDVMQKHAVFQLVFSSSATVYGDPASVPIREDFPRSATNPYGQSKLMVEHILQDLGRADARWSVALLRYFNPVGAHRSGLIGEDPSGIPNNLMPYISQVACGKLEVLSVFGDDYPTSDGTGVRDYIHVVDLAKGHIRAVEKVTNTEGVHPYNLGTGQGYSVLEMISAFERGSGQQVGYQIVARRPGDIAMCYADPAFAEQTLGWKAELTLDDMTQDTWRWQSANPNGYKQA